MLIKIAWRSLWRNRRRTLITVCSIGLGLTFAIFFISLGEGIYDRMIDQVVRMQAGHITLQHPEYAEAPAVDLYLDGISGLRSKMESWPEVEKTKLIVMGQGIAKSGYGNVAAAIMGVEPSVEASVSPLVKNIVDGAFLEDGDLASVVIGSEMAERLNLKVGKKLVVSANDVNGDLVEELARVKGIFKTGSDELDAYIVVMPIDFAWKVFQIPEKGAIQLGLILKDPGDRKKVLEYAKKAVGRRPIAVLPWEDVVPDVASYIKVDKGSNFIFQGLLLFLITFTIFNTILMSVLERQKEFAVLISIGTEPSQIRLQLLMEAIFLGLVGCGAGLLFGGLIVYLVHVYGIDMSSIMGEGISVSGFAISSTMHTKMSAGILLGAAGIIFAATVLLSLIPMGRAAKVNIVDTLR